MMASLDNCEICGGEARVMVLPEVGLKPRVYIACERCGTRIPAYYGTDAAAAAWNDLQSKRRNHLPRWEARPAHGEDVLYVICRVPDVDEGDPVYYEADGRIYAFADLGAAQKFADVLNR